MWCWANREDTQTWEIRPAMPSWKHLRTILLLPGMVTLAIPGMILGLTGPDTLGLWRSIPASRGVLPVLGVGRSAPPPGLALPVLGVPCLGRGLALAVATIRLFRAVGEGTIAPWDPP